MPTKKKSNATKFLNVDVDIYSNGNLSTLLKALEDHIIVLNHERASGLASFEAAKQPKSIDAAILAFFKMIDSLPPRERLIWDNCKKRCMNIGVQCGQAPHGQEFYLSKKTITYLLALQAEVVFTVYRCFKEQE